MMMGHSKMHWACCWRPMASNILWVAGFICLILSWVAIYKKNLVFGLEPLAWYWNALVLGVLAVGQGGRCGCGSCEASDSKMM